MTTYKLTNEEINDQKKHMNKYADLIEKELSYDDLANWDNIYQYWKSYEAAKKLVQNPEITLN